MNTFIAVVGIILGLAIALARLSIWRARRSRRRNARKRGY